MRMQGNCWVIVEKALHLRGCWFLNMHLMGHCMSTFIVSYSSTLHRLFALKYFISSNHTKYLSTDGEGCQLSWTRRMNIVIGIARGLKYLHTEIEPPFTISELNSSAVYLTEDFSPKVSQKLIE